MAILETVEGWFFHVAVAKAVKRGIPWLVSLATLVVGRGDKILGTYGVHVSVDNAALTVAIGLALSVAQNWAKNRLGVKWL